MSLLKAEGSGQKVVVAPIPWNPDIHEHGDLDLTESRIAEQALAQEQALFDRNMEKDHALFKLHVVMGWATVLMVPTTVVISILIPPAAFGLVPLTGLAGWNWRRMLKRDGGQLETTTKLLPKK
jgi:hypothetical protein